MKSLREIMYYLSDHLFFDVSEDNPDPLVDNTVWSIGISYTPDSPDKFVTLLANGGGTSDTTIPYDKPSFIVQVRGDEFGYSEARQKMDQIWKALHDGNVPNHTYFLASGSPRSIGYDKKNRPTIEATFRTMRLRS